jgi:hypothetical protein
MVRRREAPSRTMRPQKGAAPSFVLKTENKTGHAPRGGTDPAARDRRRMTLLAVRLPVLQRGLAAIRQLIELVDHALLDASAARRDAGAERTDVSTTGLTHTRKRGASLRIGAGRELAAIVAASKTAAASFSSRSIAGLTMRTPVASRKASRATHNRHNRGRHRRKAGNSRSNSGGSRPRVRDASRARSRRPRARHRLVQARAEREAGRLARLILRRAPQPARWRQGRVSSHSPCQRWQVRERVDAPDGELSPWWFAVVLQ